MKRKIIKKILISFLTIIIVMLTLHTRSYAYELNSMNELLGGYYVGDTIKLARDSTQTSNAKDYLASSNLMYCLQYGKTCNASDYKIMYYLTIDGATSWNHTHDKFITKSENLALAYILGSGSYKRGWNAGGGHDTIRQDALWSYGSTWMNQVGSSYGINWTVGGNRFIYKCSR